MNNAREQYLEHLANLTDEALAADATWDDDSFNELHRRYGHLLMVYLLRSNSVETAHEICATAWNALRNGCKNLAPGPLKSDGRVRPWLFSIAMNAAIDLSRKTNAPA